MQNFSKFIIRHVRENLKKCSLRGLEERNDFFFFSYPDCALGKEKLPFFSKAILLDLEGEPLSKDDECDGIIVLDATWRLSQKMRKQIPELETVQKRSIPAGFVTAYPRCQHDCIDPQAGLASIEALWIALQILKKDNKDILNNYYWKDIFFNKNTKMIQKYE